MLTAPRPLVQLADISAAFGLLTRLPIKVDTDHALRRGAAAAWAYPLVGIAVAGIASCLIFAMMTLGLSPLSAAFLGVILQVLITGALHEDGLSDCADGIFGAWTRADRLRILRDSRIGAYGAIALILSLGLRISLIGDIAGQAKWVGGLIAAAVISRAAMVWVMTNLPHARRRGLAARVGRPRKATAYLGVALAIGGGLLLIGVPALVLALFAGLTATSFARLAKARLGGQTGDVLGATQQLTEISCLICLAALL
ncbi:MAG: adenosylcobinamide-GDP ribazoletransferase [Mangrovicoccus sp.]